MISEIQKLIDEVAKLPTIGQRSARKIVLFLLKNKDKNLSQLSKSLLNANNLVITCKICGNLDLSDICSICASANRCDDSICIVESVEDLWVIERSKCFKGKYHVLNGLLSAIDDITPDSLRIPELILRCKEHNVQEVIMGLSLNLDARITSCYISDILNDNGVSTYNLAAGIPVGGELNYMDDSTISMAFQDRKRVSNV